MTRPVLAALLLGLSACRTARLPETTPVDDPDLQRRWRSAVFVPATDARGTQRVVLSLGETQVDVTVLMQLRRPDTLRLAAVDDLGATRFHVLATGGATDIVQGSSFLDDAWLAGWAADLALLFLGPPVDDLALVRTDAGETALAGAAAGATLLLRREAAKGPLDRLDTADAQGRWRSTIRVSDWKRDEAGEVLCPERFVLEDARGRFRMEALVVRWQAEAAP